MSKKKLNKREKVLHGNKKKLIRFELLIPIIILLIGFVFIISQKPKKGEMNFGNTFVSYKKIKANDGIISIPISNFNDYKAKYYKYAFPEKTVYFFILKSSDGVIRAAFDSCDVCFRARKGYRQDNDIMICNNCGQTFPSVRINVEKGGCNPASLKREIRDNKLVINVTDLYNGFQYF